MPKRIHNPDEIYEKSICRKKETAPRKEEESKLDATNCPKWPKVDKPESDRVHSLLFNFYIFSMRWFKIWLTWPRLSGVLFSCGGFDILWPWRLELWPACRRFLRHGPSLVATKLESNGAFISWRTPILLYLVRKGDIPWCGTLVRSTGLLILVRSSIMDSLDLHEKSLWALCY